MGPLSVNFDSAASMATKFQSALNQVDQAAVGSVDKSTDTELIGNNKALTTYTNSQSICKALAEGLREDIANLQTVAADFKAAEEKAQSIINNNTQSFKNPLDEVLGHE